MSSRFSITVPSYLEQDDETFPTFLYTVLLPMPFAAPWFSLYLAVSASFFALDHSNLHVNLQTMGISHRSASQNRSKVFLQDKSEPKRSHQQTNHREMAPKRHGQGKMLVSVPVLRIVDAQANGARRRIRENTAQFQMCHGLVYYMKQHLTQERQCKNLSPISTKLATSTGSRGATRTLTPKDQYIAQRARGAYIASVCQPEASFDLSFAA